MLVGSGWLVSLAATWARWLIRGGMKRIIFIIFVFLGFMRVAGRKNPKIDPRQHLGAVTQGTSPVTT
jgi:hypothetical protein